MKPINIHYAQLVPRFIRQDKSGCALCEAIDTAIQPFLTDMANADAWITDPASMPEWALNEKAWELGILYDYTAQVEEKRRWISESVPVFAAYGTPRAIHDYLSGVFETVIVHENWRYGGEAFHFRVLVSGEYTNQKEAWALKAIGQTKNVRSVLDALVSVQGADNGFILKTGRIRGEIPYPMCGDPVCGGEMYLT